MTGHGGSILWAAFVVAAILGCASVPPAPRTQIRPVVTMRHWNGFSPDRKLEIARAFILEARRNNVIMELPAEYYVQELDALVVNTIANEGPGALDVMGLGLTFHVIAAMEGDWDSGEDKCDHARKFLGEKTFQDFKERFPEKYERLCDESSRHAAGS